MTARVIRLPWPPDDLIAAAQRGGQIGGRDRQRAADYMVICQGDARRQLDLPAPYEEAWRGVTVEVEFHPPANTDFKPAMLKRAAKPGFRGVAAVIGVKVDDWKGRPRCTLPYGSGQILLRVEPVQ